MKKFTPRQLRLVIACFAAYSAAYVSRTNLAPALAAIQADFSLTGAQIGMLPTLFAIPYAIGQIINGTLADHFRPRNFILCGLVGSAMVNIAFSMANAFWMLMLLWCLNGCLQSMIWTPIVRIMATEFEDDVRPRAMFAMSVTMILGNLVAWLLSGWLTANLSWKFAFRACGSITLIAGIGSFIAMGGGQKKGAARKKDENIARAGLLKLVFGTDLCFLMLCCMLIGYVRDGIMNWAPKLLMDTQGIDLSSAMGMVMILPVINFIGVQMGRLTYGRMGGDARRTCTLMTALCVGFSLILTFFYGFNPIVCALLLALCSAMMNGLSPLMTAFMPMRYSHLGRVGMAAGLIDCMFYVGNAISGTFAGYVHDHLGWSAVFASWALCCAGSVVFYVLAMRRRRG